jgi:hypothetical protein
MPDLLVLDGLETESLLNLGYLQELTGKLNTEDIFENAQTPFIIDDKLMAVSMRISPILVGSSAEKIDSLTSLDDIQNTILSSPVSNVNIGIPQDGTQEKPAVAFVYSDDVAETFYYPMASDIWKNNTFNEEAARKYFEYVDSIVKYKGLTSLAKQYEDTSTMPFLPNYLNSSSVGFLNNMSDFFTLVGDKQDSLLDPFMSINMMNGNEPRIIDGVYTPLFGLDGKSYFTTNEIVGMCNGANANAIDFINYCLGKDVQRSGKTNGISVNKLALKEFIASYKTNYANINITVDMNTDLVAMFENMLPYLPSTMLDKTMVETAVLYTGGNISLDEVINQVNNKTSLYLAEKVR